MPVSPKHTLYSLWSRAKGVCVCIIALFKHEHQTTVKSLNSVAHLLQRLRDGRRSNRSFYPTLLLLLSVLFFILPVVLLFLSLSHRHVISGSTKKSKTSSRGLLFVLISRTRPATRTFLLNETAANSTSVFGHVIPCSVFYSSEDFSCKMNG